MKVDSLKSGQPTKVDGQKQRDLGCLLNTVFSGESGRSFDTGRTKGPKRTVRFYRLFEWPFILARKTVHLQDRPSLPQSGSTNPEIINESFHLNKFFTDI